MIQAFKIKKTYTAIIFFAISFLTVDTIHLAGNAETTKLDSDTKYDTAELISDRCDRRNTGFIRKVLSCQDLQFFLVSTISEIIYQIVDREITDQQNINYKEIVKEALKAWIFVSEKKVDIPLKVLVGDRYGSCRSILDLIIFYLPYLFITIIFKNISAADIPEKNVLRFILSPAGRVLIARGLELSTNIKDIPIVNLISYLNAYPTNKFSLIDIVMNLIIKKNFGNKQHSIVPLAVYLLSIYILNNLTEPLVENGDALISRLEDICSRKYLSHTKKTDDSDDLISFVD